MNGLEDFLNKFKGKRSSSISSFEFDKGDIQREDVVREVLDIYSSSSVPESYLLKEDPLQSDTVDLDKTRES